MGSAVGTRRTALALALAVPLTLALQNVGSADAARAAQSPYAKAVLSDAPTTYWRVGEPAGTALADSGPAGVTATASGESELGIGGAVTGDADTAMSGGFSAPAGRLPSGAAPRTLEAWFLGGSRSVSLQYGRVGTADAFVVSVQPEAGVITVGSGDTFASLEFAVPYPVDDGAWHLLDVGYDGTTASVLLDGQPVGTGPLAGLDTVVAGESLVVEAPDGVDEVAVYPHAVDATRLTTRWRVGAAGVSACALPTAAAYPVMTLGDSPVAYYRLGDLSRNPGARLASDASGRCGDAAVSSGSAPVAGALIADGDAAIRGRLHASAAGLPAGAAARTIEAWLLGDRRGADLGYGDRESSDAFEVSARPEAGTVTVSHGDTLGAVTLRTGRFDDGAWHLLDVTLADGVVTGYLDGLPIGSGPLGGLTTATVGQSLRVDAPGGIDEFVVYPNALAPATVGQHFLRGSDRAKSVVRGTVTASGQPVPGAIVESCDGEGSCSQIETDAVGRFRFTGGYATYTLKVFPPTSGVGSTASFTQSVATTSEQAPYAQVDIPLVTPSLPPDSSLSSASGGTVTSGQPTINWGEPSLFKTTACPHGFGYLLIRPTGAPGSGGGTQFVPMSESPVGSGNYLATIPPLSPMHGPASVIPQISCGPRYAFFPRAGTTSGGTTVFVRLSTPPAKRVTGIDFGGAAGAAFGRGSSTFYSVQSPAGTGDVPLSVRFADGSSQSLGTFHYFGGTVTGPAEGSASGGQTITIDGSGFTPGSRVLIGGRPSIATTVVSPVRITALVPPGTGTADILVAGSGGAASAGSYTYHGSPPAAVLIEYQTKIAKLGFFAIDLFEAAERGRGNAALTMAYYFLDHVLGEEVESRLSGEERVYFQLLGLGAQVLPLFFPEFALPIIATMILVQAFIILVDPSGTVVDSNGVPVAGARVELFRQVRGRLRPVADGDQTIEPSTNPLLTDATGAFAWQATAGDYQVAASSPECLGSDGSPAVVRTEVFTIPPERTGIVLELPCALAAPPRPEVTSITPAELDSAGGDPVTITGTGFTPDSTVKFGAAAVPVTFVSPTALQVNTPSGTGSVPVKVRSAAGTSVVSASSRVTFRDRGPIPGTEFVGQGAVDAAVSFQSALTGVDAITASVPGVVLTSVGSSGATTTALMSVASTVPVGPVSLTLRRPDGRTTSCAACMTITPAPELRGQAAPVTVTPGGGARVATWPLELQPGGTLRIAGVPGVTIKVLGNSGTVVTARVRASAAVAPGGYGLTALNPDGGRASYDGLVLVR